MYSDGRFCWSETRTSEIEVIFYASLLEKYETGENSGIIISLKQSPTFISLIEFDTYH
jgi:hypothetical protein